MFESIVGHSKQKEILSKIIDSGNISHAYLFFGDSGIGKKKIAIDFAKKILNVDSLENCPDFKILSKMPDKKEIIVEQIRKDLIDDVYIVPAAGNRKVYIIDDAQDLNIASQNTLLKTLEEPPQYVTIILIASTTSNFLTTILSRVNQIPFEGLSKEELKNYINNNLNVNFSEDMLEYINGSIGKAIEIEQNNLIEKFSDVDKLYDILNALDISQALIYSSKIEFDLNGLLDYLEFKLFLNKKYNCIKIVENAKLRLKFNGNYDIIIDSMILRIIDNIKEG